MRIVLNLIILGLQGITTFIALVVIYMAFALLDYQGGIDGFIGTTLFQPIIGGFISVMTIGVCLLVGIPIRINSRINFWWRERFWLSISGVLLGLSLIVISVLPAMTETINATIEDEIIKKQIQDLAAATMGWFLTAFSLLHVFPPNSLRSWTERLISKYTGWESKNAGQHSA
jgi:hypothetical protein